MMFPNVLSSFPTLKKPFRDLLYIHETMTISIIKSWIANLKAYRGLICFNHKYTEALGDRFSGSKGNLHTSTTPSPTTMT